jgi:hypothetical protein
MRMPRPRFTGELRTMRIVAVTLLGSIALASTIPGARAGGDGIHVDTSNLGPPEKIYVHDGGRLALERSVDADTDEARAIMAWLKSHEDGWRYSFRTSNTSYAPNKYIRGKRFTLNFTRGGGFCVLNYQVSDKGAMHQLIREIAKDDPIPKVFHAVP